MKISSEPNIPIILPTWGFKINSAHLFAGWLLREAPAQVFEAPPLFGKKRKEEEEACEFVGYSLFMSDGVGGGGWQGRRRGDG